MISQAVPHPIQSWNPPPPPPPIAIWASTVPHTFHHPHRPHPGPPFTPRLAIEIFPPHHPTEPSVELIQRRHRPLQVLGINEPIPIARAGQRAHHHLLRPPSPPQYGIVVDKGLEPAPIVVKLRVVPRDTGPAHRLQRFVREPGEVGTALERGGDGGEGDEEVGPEVGLEAVDEADDAGQGHLLLDVQVQPVETVPPDHVPQGHVVGFELPLAPVEPSEAALGRTAQHAEDLDADVLHDGGFFPQDVVFGRVWRVIVEVDVAGGVIEVDGRDDQVGNWNEIGGFSEKGQKGDETVSVVVGLVVEDYAGLVGWMVGGRHC